MKKYVSLLVIFAAFLLAACGGKTTPPDVPPITEPDQTIEVKAGEEFKITLETNLNTELHWEVAVALDTAVVDYVWKDFVAKNGSDSVGWDVWTFKAVAPGTTTISLGYYRGLTEETAKMAVFTIIVQ